VNEIKKPAISIVIPTLNEEMWIKKNLKSIKNQTFKNYEIIVVDSYSKDKTLEIAKKYGCKLIYCDAKGPGFARNIGSNKSRGEILVFIDADTSIESNFLTKVSETLKNRKVACCAPEVKIVDGNIVYDILLKLLWMAANFLIILGRPGFGGVCVAVRKVSFAKIGGFSTEMIEGEDLDMVYRISKIGEVKVINSWCFTSKRRTEKFGSTRMILFYMFGFLKFVLTGNPQFKNLDLIYFSDRKKLCL